MRIENKTEELRSFLRKNKVFLVSSIKNTRMISVADALKLINISITPLRSETIALKDALGYTLSETVYSKINMPPFDQSAMDGYALNGSNTNTFKIIGEIQAGDNTSKIDLKEGEAVRIFTGGMVPKTATTVVKQEITERIEHNVVILEAFEAGTNIRYTAEQINVGELALKKGAQLNAAAIGFLAMLGVASVSVFRKPKVRVLITGNELIAVGKELAPGQIYESNSATLIAALQELSIDAEAITVSDDYGATYECIQRLLWECDILISSGGISVGDYDFVGKALRANGVREVFYKVKQKPGKPLLYGTSETCHVFALPGNPASALTGLYLYVYPAIYKMMGREQSGLTRRKVRINQAYSKTTTMTHFLKGFVHDTEVELLENQSSAMLNSFAAANCLIQMEEGRTEWFPNDVVTVIMLP